MSGENNPFWGKNHDKETKDHLKSVKRARPRSPTGPPRGYKHTHEALEKMRFAMKERWRVNRDKMLLQIQHDPKPREEQRYRFTFTPWQRANWKNLKCAWCDATENLVLDHIIPVMCGGLNEHRNAQTLCTPCNMWKLKHVDRPLLLAGLGKQGGQN